MAKDCKEPKRDINYEYHKEKMLLCKKGEAGAPLTAKENDFLAERTNEEDENQELSANCIFMAPLQ